MVIIVQRIALALNIACRSCILSVRYIEARSFREVFYRCNIINSFSFFRSFHKQTPTPVTVNLSISNIIIAGITTACRIDRQPVFHQEYLLKLVCIARVTATIQVVIKVMAIVQTQVITTIHDHFTISTRIMRSKHIIIWIFTLRCLIANNLIILCQLHSISYLRCSTHRFNQEKLDFFFYTSTRELIARIIIFSRSGPTCTIGNKSRTSMIFFPGSFKQGYTRFQQQGCILRKTGLLHIIIH